MNRTITQQIDEERRTTEMLNAASRAMDDQLDKLKLERERVREEERMLEEKYRKMKKIF